MPHWQKLAMLCQRWWPSPLQLAATAWNKPSGAHAESCCKERLPRPRTLTLASQVLYKGNIEVYRKRSLVQMLKIRRGAIFTVIMLEQTKWNYSCQLSCHATMTSQSSAYACCSCWSKTMPLMHVAMWNTLSTVPSFLFHILSSISGAGWEFKKFRRKLRRLT